MVLESVQCEDGYLGQWSAHSGPIGGQPPQARGFSSACFQAGTSCCLLAEERLFVMVAEVRQVQSKMKCEGQASASVDDSK